MSSKTKCSSAYLVHAYVINYPELCNYLRYSHIPASNFYPLYFSKVFKIKTISKNLILFSSFQSARSLILFFLFFVLSSKFMHFHDSALPKDESTEIAFQKSEQFCDKQIYFVKMFTVLKLNFLWWNFENSVPTVCYIKIKTFRECHFILIS